MAKKGKGSKKVSKSAASVGASLCFAHARARGARRVTLAFFAF
jgi:hypothetical protein